MYILAVMLTRHLNGSHTFANKSTYEVNVRIADHAGSDLGTAVPYHPSAADYGERSIL